MEVQISVLEEPVPNQIPELKIQLAERIKAVIKASGKSQWELAAISGCHQPRLSELKNDKLERFSLDSLVTIANCLGIAVSI